MTQTAAEQLAVLRTMVEEARAVPLSTSCLISRAQTLQALDALAAAFADELAEARRDSGIGLVEDARAEAERIVAEAREQAAALVSTDAVHADAVRAASELTESTHVEAEELKREADVYVDQRLASLEASLAKTLSQLRTMRARLSERSGLDREGDETVLLPRYPAR